MRHRKAGIKLNRTSSHRKAMFRNMVTSLFKYERIRTTDTKAKELRRWADHLIVLAKRGDLHARRQALSIIREKDVVSKLFNEAAGWFDSREGGFTRIVKLGRRQGDAAPTSLIELVFSEKEKKKITKKGKSDGSKKRQASKAKALKDKKEDTSPEKVAEKSSAENSSDPESKSDQATSSSSVTDDIDESNEAAESGKKSDKNLEKSKEK